MIRIYTLEIKKPFLFEEWSEPYLQYGEVNTGKEKDFLSKSDFGIVGFASYQKGVVCRL